MRGGEGGFGEHLRHVVVQPARVRREQQRLVLQILERDGALFRERVPRIEHDHHRIVHEVDVLKRAAADQREKAQVDIPVVGRAEQNLELFQIHRVSTFETARLIISILQKRAGRVKFLRAIKQ